jgi:hypothetical protein
MANLSLFELGLCENGSQLEQTTVAPIPAEPNLSRSRACFPLYKPPHELCSTPQFSLCIHPAATMIITTGIHDAPILCRLELCTFLEDQDVTNLYILATDQMMRIKQDDLTSWFQLAAIHGRCVDSLMWESHLLMHMKSLYSF